MMNPPENDTVLRVIRDRLMSLFEPQVIRSVQGGRGFSLGTTKGSFRDDNQDRAAAVRVRDEQGRSAFVAVICDGMGGLVRGGDAAAIAISAFLAALGSKGLGQLRESLEYAIHYANNAVYAALDGRGGTTLTALVIPDLSTCWCVHVGDSRLYVRTDGEKGIRQLSHDDTLGNVVLGGDASFADNRNSLIQFVGMGEGIEPHVEAVRVGGEHFFILTSDGVHGALREAFSEICLFAPSAEELTKRLLITAEAVGTNDNATAISVRPREFAQQRTFPAGSSLIIWTASRHLEIWMPPGAVSYSATPNSSVGSKSPSSAKDDKKRTRGGKRKSLRAGKVEPSADDQNQSKPQLKIEFEGDDRKADD